MAGQTQRPPPLPGLQPARQYIVLGVTKQHKPPAKQAMAAFSTITWAASRVVVHANEVISHQEV